MGAWYRDNPEKAKAWHAERWAQFREFIDGIKLGSGCVDCGYRTHPAALQFDHLGGKTYNVSKMYTYSRSRLEEEIAKCEVVCANCHAIRTARRRSDG